MAKHRSARTRKRLRALLCEVAQAYGPDPTRTGQATWNQRAGHSALGARRALSQTRASQAVARALSPAQRLCAESRARGSGTTVVGSRLTWLIGIYALVFGALLVILGFQWRRLERKLVMM